MSTDDLKNEIKSRKVELDRLNVQTQRLFALPNKQLINIEKIKNEYEKCNTIRNKNIKKLEDLNKKLESIDKLPKGSLKLSEAGYSERKTEDVKDTLDDLNIHPCSFKKTLRMIPISV